MSFQKGSQKFKSKCLIHAHPTFLSFTSLSDSKLWKPYKTDNLNSANIKTLALPIFKIFVQGFLVVNFSLNQNSPDCIVLCVAKLFDCNNFSVKVYLLLIWKNFVVQMHDLAVQVNEGNPFECNVKIWRFLVMLSAGFTPFIVLVHFPLLMLFHLT